MKYAGAVFFVLVLGFFLVIVGITGRFGIALACLIDPHDVQDSSDDGGSDGGGGGGSTGFR